MGIAQSRNKKYSMKKSLTELLKYTKLYSYNKLFKASQHWDCLDLNLVPSEKLVHLNAIHLTIFQELTLKFTFNTHQPPPQPQTSLHERKVPGYVISFTQEDMMTQPRSLGAP